MDNQPRYAMVEKIIGRTGILIYFYLIIFKFQDLEEELLKYKYASLTIRKES
jgi:hypothetical protein